MVRTTGFAQQSVTVPHCSTNHCPVVHTEHTLTVVNGMLWKAQGIPLLQATLLSWAFKAKRKRYAEQQDFNNPLLFVRASPCTRSRGPCSQASPWAELQPPDTGRGSRHGSFGPAPPHPGTPPAAAPPWRHSWCFEVRLRKCRSILSNNFYFNQLHIDFFNLFYHSFFMQKGYKFGFK